jgi:N utilization substance protein A
VRQVVTELRGEKVDIVPYTDDAADFVMKALAPARVREVRIHPDTGTAEVIVPDFQLSLAIGKEGQNARLAARLTGWRVDIKSETQLAEEESGGGVEYAEGEWVENASGELVWQPAEGGDAISAAEAGYAEPFAGKGATGTGAEDGTPAGGAPETPATDAPATDAPATDAPAADAPAADAPAADAPAAAVETSAAEAATDGASTEEAAPASAEPAAVAATDGVVAEEESSGES